MPIKGWIITVLVAGIYLPTFRWMVENFLKEESFYTHGFLIPVVSLVILWQKRDELKSLHPNPSTRGLIFVCIAIILHILSQLIKVDFTSGFSLVMLIWGLSLYFGGKEIAYKVWFPIWYLLFMIPLPTAFTTGLTYKMRLFATFGGITGTKWLGIPVWMQGPNIYLPDTYLSIGSPCSGLHSLIALMALGSVIAYFLPAKRSLKKWILFLSTIPIAIFSNIIRIILLTLIAYIYGNKSATEGVFHMGSGFIVFIIAFICLLGVRKVLLWEKKNAPIID